MRRLGAAVVAALLSGAGMAQEGVRLLPGDSAIEDRWRGLEVTLALSGATPWRVFTLDDPRRLVVDLRGVAWDAGDPGAILGGDNAGPVRFGPVRGGWSRLMVELGRPMEVTEAGLAVGEDGARLRLVLGATSEEAFAAAAGPPPEEGALPAFVPQASSRDDSRFVVAIDPGHGGIDPGAERGGLREAHLMLALGLELAQAVELAGMVPVLTRREDVFVPLQERMTLARAGGADVLLSLHADALEEDAAAGASVYTLTQEAVGDASAGMVQRHEGGDLIAGLDLKGQEDEVATALMDLARLDTAPRSERLAAVLAAALGQAGATVNRQPLRRANLAVLKAADFPSVLLEAGSLSDPGDRARLSTPEGRAPVVRGIVAALEAWAGEEAGRAALLRR
jgi:N-acetylmuramoyl-L-alanine amidase